ncbi:MAG TPA: DUF1552 domain-containing protein [Polyangia bacterium]|jgi:hypothetical protein|nr:DUF1552 domain-containing protein [Polyangia bacterium]
MKTPRPQFSRRDLLKAAGTTLAVPLFLKNAFAAAAAAAPPNLVLLQTSNGTHQASFWPAAGSFDSVILHTLLTDPVLGPRTTLIKGINHHAIGSPSGNGHDIGFHGLYSGFDTIAGPGGSFGGGISLDQRIAREVPFASGKLKNIHCGVHAVDYMAINAGRISFSAVGPGQQIPCELDLYALYDKVFGVSAGSPANPAAAQTRLAQRKSVLDLVASDLVTLEKRLGPQERQKVDIHLTAVRDFESRLSANSGPVTGACSTTKPSLTGVNSGGQGNEVNAEVLQHLFMEFIANTVGCNMVGVLSFQFGRGGDHFHYKWLDIPGMPSDAHDFVAHLDNGDANIARIFIEIKKWYTTIVSELATRLSKIPQGDGKTALDNALVVWGNEIATGPHDLKDIPVVLLGGARGHLKRTGYVVDAGAQPHQRLGATVLNIMGVPATGFGGLTNSGLINGLGLA